MMAKKKKPIKWDRHSSKFRFDVANELPGDRLVDMSVRYEVGSEMRMYVTDAVEDPLDMLHFVQTMRENPDMDIIVEVNSIGGSVTQAMGMFNAMVEHAGDITVQITGEASSAGMTIAAGADKTIANENAAVFVHPANISVLWASEPELLMATQMVRKATEQTIDLLTARSGSTRDVIEQLVTGNSGMGTTLTAKEALDVGLVDEVRETPKKTRNSVPDSVMAMARAKAAMARAQAAVA